MEENKSWCPIMNSKCRMDCEWMTDDEVYEVSCSIRKIAEHLDGGSIAIKTYAKDAVCVTTDPEYTDTGFHVHCHQCIIHLVILSRGMQVSARHRRIEEKLRAS